MTSVSVVIPTLDEAGSIAELLRRMSAAVAGMDVTVTIVDDGCDDLPAVVASLGPALGMSVQVIRRDRPAGRLGGAVLVGIEHSRADVIVVCDGDLQHPPELIPALVAKTADSEVVVASRYLADGRADGLAGTMRRLVSRASVAVSKVVFPRRLRGCSDPMSGYFAFRRGAVELANLRPAGYKILLEMIARSRPLRLAEIGFVFGDRFAGRSHASLSEGMRFAAQLVVLRTASLPRPIRFLLVGSSGVVPNLVLIYALTQSGVGYLLASVCGVQLGVLWNFAGAEWLVWNEHRPGELGRRLASFVLIAETDLARIPFVYLIVDAWGFRHSVLAALITMVVAFLLRFSLADKLVYRRAVPVRPGHTAPTSGHTAPTPTMPTPGMAAPNRPAPNRPTPNRPAPTSVANAADESKGLSSR